MVKTKIIKVDLNFPEQSQDEIVIENPPDEYSEAKNEASINDIIQSEEKKSCDIPIKVKTINKQKSPVEEIVEEDHEAKPHDSKLQVSPATNVVEEIPIEKAKPIEAKPIEELPVEKKTANKTDDKVTCQHCNKQMSLKSLRYSHARNCNGLKQTIEKVSNEKVEKKKASQPVEQPPIEQSTIQTSQPQAPIIEKTYQPGILPQKQPFIDAIAIHPRIARMNAIKDRYSALGKQALHSGGGKMPFS